MPEFAGKFKECEVTKLALQHHTPLIFAGEVGGGSDFAHLGKDADPKKSLNLVLVSLLFAGRR